jgi:hypothetical protein
MGGEQTLINVETCATVRSRNSNSFSPRGVVSPNGVKSNANDTVKTVTNKGPKINDRVSDFKRF